MLFYERGGEGSLALHLSQPSLHHDGETGGIPHYLHL